MSITPTFSPTRKHPPGSPAPGTPMHRAQPVLDEIAAKAAAEKKAARAEQRQKAKIEAEKAAKAAAKKARRK